MPSPVQRARRPPRPVHVIAGLDPAQGGPSYSVPRLCEALAAEGLDPVLLSVAAGRNSPCDTRHGGYRERRFVQDLACVPGLRALRRSTAFSTALKETVAAADLVHDHGLWLSPNLQAGWVAAAAGKPFVVSPRGMLSPPALAFSRTKKRVFWHLLQGPVMRRTACIHATSDQEYAELREFGLRQPIAVIPNGIDIPDPVPDACNGIVRERIVLSLGRMHPKKNLEILLRAWAEVEPLRPGWRLDLVGPGDDRYVRQLRALSCGLGLRRVSFGGPVYGSAKWDAYRAADLFVLPSLNENFGLTVAEALAAGYAGDRDDRHTVEPGRERRLRLVGRPGAGGGGSEIGGRDGDAAPGAARNGPQGQGVDGARFFVGSRRQRYDRAVFVAGRPRRAAAKCPAAVTGAVCCSICCSEPAPADARPDHAADPHV